MVDYGGRAKEKADMQGPEGRKFFVCGAHGLQAHATEG
jgi:hypothetical protein